MRKLATIREIKEIKPIANADSLELAIIDGWEVVINKKENLKANDLVVYFEIDAILPERPEFEFLRSKKFRIRTIKLRGQVSQGLVMPLLILPSGHKAKLGDDVTEILGVKKHNDEDVKPIETKKPKNKFVKLLTRFKWFRDLQKRLKGKDKTAFPSWIKKTDEPRIQNLSIAFEDWKRHNYAFDVTEKIDGCSATYYLDGRHLRGKAFEKPHKYEFGVASRNRSLPKSDDSAYWTVAVEYKLREAMEFIATHTHAKTVVIQGEIIGEKIQGNKYGYKRKNDEFHTYEFYVYNLIIDGEKLNYEAMDEWMAATHSLRPVPLLFEYRSLEDSIPEMVDFAKGKSTLADIKREGLVWRNNEKGISFKVINAEFLLAYDE